ncbi:MAG: CehA/McbA family metallohydrolase [Chthonomonadetes bacterium]|nr:CehA/McbA family metallohydrolase [Chthonomonadetes bacterium]
MLIADNPYAQRYPLWLKGNLHTHTALSDGELPPEETVQACVRRGYDYVALSDHDVIAAVPEEHFPQIIVLSGVEHSAQQHILRVNVLSTLPHDLSYQSVIDLTVQAGGLVILNHPNWGENYDHWRDSQLSTLERYHGIEIYNNVIEYLEGSAYALDRWDRLLSQGKRVWGYANEDTHRIFQIGSAWNMVNVRERSREALLEGLKTGRFYASRGVILEEIAVEDGYLRVRSANAKELRLISLNGEVLERVTGSAATFSLSQARVYARVEAIGEGSARAWTQPVFLE